MKGKKSYKIELARGSLIIWCLVIVVLIVWAFFLGFFVGSGLFSEEEGTLEIKKKEIQKKEKANILPKFSFHKELTETKEKNKEKEDCYSVQVVAYLKEKDAIALVKKLSLYNPYYIKEKTDGKIFYKVRCGRLKNKKEAIELKERILKETHLKGIIVKCR